MRLTIATEDGNAFNVDVDKEMELENVKALLEAESGIATDDQALFHTGKQLLGDKETLASFNIAEDDMLLLARKPQQTPSAGGSGSAGGAGTIAGRDINAESETMRRQLLGNPGLMEQLRATQPELASAALSSPERFRDLLSQFSQMQNSAQLAKQHEADLLNADPYNVEAQRKIEEAIRQERVLENMESAMENMPEAFGSVHMLYVETEVNGVAVKAFVDSGAQSTIMSPECAERCGIMRLIDTRFAGMARGVGTAKILGRVHSAQMKMGDLYLQCSFTILEGKDVDLLFGLDMLKRHQAIIDLQKDALVIQGREIRFLSEHELPKNFISGAGGEEEFEFDAQGYPVPLGTSTGGTTSASSSSASTSTAAPTPFPGSGHTLSAPPASTPPIPLGSPAPPSSSSRSKYPEEAISSLVNLGVDRNEAIKLLDAAGGNAELAASLLFSGDGF